MKQDEMPVGFSMALAQNPEAMKNLRCSAKIKRSK